MDDNYLPPAEQIVVETIKGKKIKKIYYADDSYGIREDDKVTRYFPDGKKQIYILKKSLEFGDENFILNIEESPDGTVRRWFNDGRMCFEKLPDGTTRSWYENGQMEIEKLPDGTERWWFADGKMSKAKLPDNTILEWDHYKKSFGIGGKLKNEKINKILTREWYENGQLAYARSPAGKEIKYDRLGKVIFHATKGKEDTEAYLAKIKEKKHALMSENLIQENDLQIADKQFAMSEKWRKKAIAKNADENLLVSKSDDNIEAKKETKNLTVSKISNNDTDNNDLEKAEIDSTENINNS